MSILDDVKDYGLNLFEDAKDWAIETGKDLYVDKVMGDYADSFKDAFVTHDKLTPELEKEGWRIGLDGQPYNYSLAEKFAPGGIFHDPDVDRNTAMAQAAQNAGVTSTPTAPASPFLSQDLRQRTPSGTIYNPSMESFENASLFDYQGPGGLAEYTYGQGLPMGYDVYGTPVGPNLYYEGQFGEGYVEPGVADNAINLPPVTMPGNVPQIPTERPTQANMPGFTSGGGGTGPGGKDLTYQETIDYFGLDPVSTTFPSPGAELVDTPASVLNAGLPDFLSDAWTGVKDFGSDLIGGLFADDGVEETASAPSMDAGLLVSKADQGPDVGLLNYTNDGAVSAADQALFNLARMESEKDTVGLPNYTNDGAVSAADQTRFNAAKAERFTPTGGPNVYETNYTSGANVPTTTKKYFSPTTSNVGSGPAGMTVPIDVAMTKDFATGNDKVGSVSANVTGPVPKPTYAWQSGSGPNKNIIGTNIYKSYNPSKEVSWPWRL